jgi:hypothetical protein
MEGTWNRSMPENISQATETTPKRSGDKLKFAWCAMVDSADNSQNLI